MIEKAELTSENDTLRIGVPFAKVDKKNRIVSGFATLNNVDKHWDVVTAEASEKAFKNFRGNIREQHLPIAAGKVVNFRQEEFYDSETNKMYTGIFVDAYVSKGAADTWEKVLDGTLSGFSIGGSITKTVSQYVPDADKTVRYITDYDLIELSLVDSPANHLCNVFSISKADGVLKADGMAVDTTVENVFWCENDSMAVATIEEKASCSACQSPMALSGWFESIGEISKADKIREVLETSGKLKKSDETKGGSKVAEKEETAVEATEPVAKEVTKADEVAGKEEASEVKEPDFDNLNKALTEIKNLVQKYDQNDQNRDTILKGVKESIEGFEKTVEGQFTSLLEKHESLSKEFNDFKSGIEAIEKRLDGVESGAAVRKSNDAENKIEKQDRSSWSGAFLPNFE